MGASSTRGVFHGSAHAGHSAGGLWFQRTVMAGAFPFCVLLSLTRHWWHDLKANRAVGTACKLIQGSCLLICGCPSCPGDAVAVGGVASLLIWPGHCPDTGSSSPMTVSPLKPSPTCVPQALSLSLLVVPVQLFASVVLV